MDKSYVTLEQAVCPVCGVKHDTGTLFMDKRLRPMFDMHTTTGWGLCEEHQKLYDEGYVAIVAADPEKSNVVKGVVTIEGAYRTGEIVHIWEELFEKLFNVPIPEGKLTFCDPEVVEYLQKLVADSEAGTD